MEEKKKSNESQEKTSEEEKKSTEEKKSPSDEEKQKPVTTEEQKSPSPEDEKKPIDAKTKPLKEDKKDKQSEERKNRRKEESTKLAKVKGPKDIVDEVQIERNGFEIIRNQLVVSGQMSNIYRAKKRKNDNDLCVKLILLDRVPKAYGQHVVNIALRIIRFVGSGGDKSGPKSPHFVRVFEIFMAQKKVYIFMELFLTLSVYTRIKTNDTITEFDAKKWSQQLMEAIDVLQVSGIAHRYIRTENVIFDKKYDIKLVGFDSAVIFWNEDTQQSTPQPKEQLPSKPKEWPKFDHFPPEVFAQDYDPSAVDVWGWAVFLCLLLHKQNPFVVKSKQSIEEQWNQFSTKFHFASNECKRLLDGIFVTDSNARLSSDGILRHKWFAEKKKKNQKKV